MPLLINPRLFSIKLAGSHTAWIFLVKHRAKLQTKETIFGTVDKKTLILISFNDKSENTALIAPKDTSSDLLSLPELDDKRPAFIQYLSTYPQF